MLCCELLFKYWENLVVTHWQFYLRTLIGKLLTTQNNCSSYKVSLILIASNFNLTI